MTQFWRNKVLTVAKKYPEIQFAVADETGFETKLSDLKLSESGEEVNVAIYDDNDYRYALVDEEFSEETLEEFIICSNLIWSGIIKTTFRSSYIYVETHKR